MATKLSLVLKLMKILEESRWKFWKGRDRDTILQSVSKKMEQTNVAR